MDALLGLAAPAYLMTPLWTPAAAVHLTAIKERLRAAGQHLKAPPIDIRNSADPRQQ